MKAILPIYDLRNHETDLTLPTQRTEFLKRKLKYNEAIHWNSLFTV